jgi:hypothetical protein
MYIKANLQIQNYPDYNINPVAFKIELNENDISKPLLNFNIRNNKTYIYNSFIPPNEINYKGGLNINLEDVMQRIRLY